MVILDDSTDGEALEVPVKPGTIRVILADSQAIYRVGIRKVFALEDDLRVVAQADSLENLQAAIERYPTDIVLMEGSLLAGTTNVIPELLRIAPEVKLIVQAVAADENQTVELYRRGVRGIVSRSISPDLLVRCVRRIAAGETWIDNQSVSWVIEAYRRCPGQSAHPAQALAQGDGHHYLHHPGQAQQGDCLPVGDHRAGDQELSAQDL
jgi:DNA-binding NarL/FixJ family response regulator